jgi:hypothetical protein
MSYLNNKIFLVISVTICWTSDNGNRIYHNTNPQTIKNMNLYDFENWYFFQINGDMKYDPDKIGEYFILLVYNPNFITIYNKENNTNVLNNLYPILPWKEKKNPIKTILKREIKKNYRLRHELTIKNIKF